MKHVVAALKALTALVVVLATLFVPLPILWVLVSRYWGEESWLAALSLGVVFTIPFGILSIMTSRALAKWFLDNWSTPYLQNRQ